MFKSALLEELRRSQFNNFGMDNFDVHRFGDMPIQAGPDDTILRLAKRSVKKVTGYDKWQQKKELNNVLSDAIKRLEKYEGDLEFLYNNLQSESKELIVKIIAYRILGFKKVKLPTNNPGYFKALETVKNLMDGTESYDPHFLQYVLKKYNLNEIGYNIKIFLTELGIAIDFIFEQYAYKRDNEIVVGAKKGDIVLDIGGCWGDTALYFAEKVGDNGKVYSFEFIPDNLKLHNINTGLNPHLQKNIELIPHPVSNKSGTPIYFWDNGPGSKIELQPFKEQTGATTTISIDDFVSNHNVLQIDFIKMDIEGAEMAALEGAIQTIRKFRPNLAIATYHSMEDFVDIPKWIVNLDLGYELFIGHYTMHAEETICFAKVNNSLHANNISSSNI